MFARLGSDPASTSPHSATPSTAGPRFDYGDPGDPAILDPIDVVGQQTSPDFSTFFYSQFGWNGAGGSYSIGDWYAQFVPPPAFAGLNQPECSDAYGCAALDGDLLGDQPGLKDFVTCGHHPIDCAKYVKPDADKAKSAASKLATQAQAQGKGNGSAHNNIFDAIRHAFWSALMARDIGQDEAKEFGDAHEDPVTYQERLETCQDLANNSIGRGIGSRFAKDASDSDVLAAVVEAAQAGQLVSFPYQCF
jgi:hypothetical protein